MSKVHKFEVPGVKANVLLTPEDLAEAVRQAITDLKGQSNPAVNAVESSRRPSLTVAAWSGMTNEGGAHVRFPLRSILGGGAYGKCAGLRIERDGRISLLGDFWGKGMDLSTHFGLDIFSGYGQFVIGSAGHKLLMAIQRRLLQVEIAKALGVTLDEAWELMQRYQIEEFSERLVSDFRVANTLVSEFGLEFGQSLDLAQKLELKSAEEVQQLRERLATATMRLPALSLEAIEELVGQLGWQIDERPVVLDSVLAQFIPEACISGERRLVHQSNPRTQLVLRPVEVEFEDPVNGEMTTVQVWDLVGSPKVLQEARGPAEKLQDLAVGTAVIQEMLKETLGDGAEADILAGESTDQQEIHLAFVEKMRRHPRDFAEAAGVQASDVQTVAKVMQQLAYVAT